MADVSFKAIDIVEFSVGVTDMNTGNVPLKIPDSPMAKKS
jgi:hypothetical protein